MFLSVDESDKGSKKVIGITVCSKEKLPLFEEKCVDFRLKNKVFGEMKWTKLSKTYYKAYADFIDIFFDFKDLTFHSVRYTNKDDKNKIIYLLIRTICWKLSIAGNTNSLCILLDEDCICGSNMIKTIQDYLRKDHRIRQDIDFLNQGKSHILNISQVTDLIAGAVRFKINGSTSNKNSRQFIDHLEFKGGSPIDHADPNMPKLNDYKIHHWQPKYANY